MPVEDLLNFIFNSLPLILVKFFTVSLLVMHVLFSVIIVRQTTIMNKIVEAKISPSIILISLFHLFLSIFVLIFAIFFF